MALFHTYNGVTPIPSANVRLRGEPDSEAQWTSSAIAGGSDTASITVDDPTGTLNLAPMHAWIVEESTCSVPRIWTGTVLTATVSRPEGAKVSAARVWHLDLIGINAGAMLRLMSARDDPKRPAETDIERIDWLVNTPTVTGGSVLFDDAYVDTSGPQDADEADFTGQTPADVMNSILGLFVVKNWWIAFNPTTLRPSLFFGANDAGVSTSTLSVSNIPGAADGVTVFAPYQDGQLTRNGEDLTSAVVVRYRGGAMLVQNTTTATTFIDRYKLLESDRIGLTATATAWATAYLNDHDTWKEQLEWTMDLPASKVNLLREGMVCTVRFSHLPGYTTNTNVVIRRRTVQQRSRDESTYTVTFMASNDAPEGAVGGGGTGGGGTGGLPLPPAADHWWQGSGTAEGDAGFNDLSPTSPLFVPGVYNYYLHVKNNYTYAARFRIMNAAHTQGWMLSGGSTGISNQGEFIWSGSFEIPDDGDPVDDHPPSGTGPYGGFQASSSGHDFLTAGGFVSGYYMQGGAAASGHVAGRIADFDFWIDLEGTTTENPPTTGQRVDNEIPSTTPDGTTTVFTTRWPYADGSLKVYVDNLDQTGAVTESDPATGEFTLAFAPRSDEVVRVWYLGR